MALAVVPDLSIFAEAVDYPHIGQIERQSPLLDALVDPEAPIEELADGFIWAEGPVWIEERRSLFFSDVPANRMYRWSESEGATLYLAPSGYEGDDPHAFREPGSNGLIRGPASTILIADQGNRAIASLDLDSRTKTFLTTSHAGKRFNSPNDLVRASNGAIYFTDPPYGLEGLNASPLKEMPFNGVFRLDRDDTVTLLERGLSFPNGIILSPDERTLFVSNSDPARAIIMAYALIQTAGWPLVGSSRISPRWSAIASPACRTAWRSMRWATSSPPGRGEFRYLHLTEHCSAQSRPAPRLPIARSATMAAPFISRPIADWPGSGPGQSA